MALQAAATAALSANVRSYRFVQHLLAKGRIEAGWRTPPAAAPAPMPTCAARPTTTDAGEKPCITPIWKS